MATKILVKPLPRPNLP